MWHFPLPPSPGRNVTLAKPPRTRADSVLRRARYTKGLFLLLHLETVRTQLSWGPEPQAGVGLLLTGGCYHTHKVTLETALNGIITFPRRGGIALFFMLPEGK